MYICALFILMFIYFWERERGSESEQQRGRERGGDTESEAASRFWAISTEPDAGLKLTTHEIMTWGKLGRSTNWATLVPQYFCAFKNYFRGAPKWLSQLSVQLAQIMISHFVGLSLVLRSLSVQSLLWIFCFSFSFSLPLLLTCGLSLSQKINKH